MKKLLIHSNNTSFSNVAIFPISEQFVFDVNLDKDVDLYIHEQLTIGPNKDKILASDVLFIKVSLSKINYLEYLGLRLAYHIRLTESLETKAHMPIVLIAEESFQYLGLTCPEPSILFTKGIYLIKESLDDYNKTINWIDEGIIKPLDDFSSFVNSITINPPSNYQSHHSIANEWALDRYTSMFKEDENNEHYIQLQRKLQDLDYLKTLHFKHLDAKANRQKFNPKKHTINPIIKGIQQKKIGIIDDEINKGWLEFYEYILSKSEAISLPFKDFRKDETKAELIKKIEEWVNLNMTPANPIDTFIVDLRLHDDDFFETDFDNLSGIKIIKILKKHNPGIQVVVSTASNKVWNYQKCLEAGVKYFSVKESPETYNTRKESIESYNHFSKQVSLAVENTFLADIFRKIDDLKNNNIFSNSTAEQDKEFANLTFGKNGLLDQIFGLLVLDNTNEAIINQCLLLSFQVLENYCDLASVGSFGSDNSTSLRLSSGFVWSKSGSKTDIFVNTKGQKISTCFELVNGKFDFQSEDANKTHVSFKVFEKMELISSYKSGLDVSSLVKIISVLHFRDNIEKKDVDEIMALRYYRSNVAAHLTGKVIRDHKRNANDIAFLIDVFTRLFK